MNKSCRLDMLAVSAMLLLAAPAPRASAAPERIELGLAAGSARPAAFTNELTMPIAFPGEQMSFVHAPTSAWTRIDQLEFDVFWPADAPTNTQVLLHLKDWDSLWYQNLLPGTLTPARTNRFRVDLSAESTAWAAAGHRASWHFRTLVHPEEFGIRLFGDASYQGQGRLFNAVGVAGPRDTPPYIRNVTVNAAAVPCFGKFELTFEIPDRYADPFDTNSVHVTADFTAPDGQTVTLDGYYGRDFFRERLTTGNRVLPQGPPYWRVRFTPVQPGAHRYRLRVRDAAGEAAWGPAVFDALPPRNPGFVRVARTDPRFLELDGGGYFHPIGHNIRSSFDDRVNHQFPWVQRWDEGTAVYARYFKLMQEHGENFTEVWFAPWSLGLEWTPKWRGYHGIGQFNMMHAWEMDRVIDEAERYGIYVNTVIHNHGKFGTSYDREWEDNPFNVQNGGYLQNPEDYFTDPRALQSFLKLMRYTIARWGYSPRVFAWELWSELNLTGSGKDGIENYKRPAVVEWHRLMGRAIREMDPYAHLVSTHVSNDYSFQNMDIVALPELCLSAADAYHFNPDPLHIVHLMLASANHNKAMGKPILITEFGGSPYAQSMKHLRETLHAALWASPCVAIGGAPIFWWWQIVDEENLYPAFSAFSRFIRGEDRRDPAMTTVVPELTEEGQPTADLAGLCFGNAERGLGWIYHKARFGDMDPLGEPAASNVAMTLRNLKDGNYAVEFWSTMHGIRIAETAASSQAGVLTVTVAPFARDIAFKIRPE